MAEQIELVDYSEEGEALRQRRRQRRRRVLIPVLGVTALMAALLAIALYSYDSNREGALALSQEVLANLEHRIHSQVESYLEPAATAVLIVAGMLQDPRFPSPAERLRVAEPLSQKVLQNLPQLAIVSYGTPKGEYLMLRRTADGAIDTKLIQRPATGTRVIWIHRNPKGQVVAVEEVPDDGFDPRDRPWYRGAVARGGLFWTDGYVFFTDHKPGVTVAAPVHAGDGTLRGVVGLDMTLGQLGAFLQSLEIGRTGRAMIIDGSGRLVAHPELDQMIKQAGEELVTAALDELGDPVLTRALSHFRLEGHGRRTFEIAGERYISTASSLRALVDRDWSVLIVVPEEDFVGFVGRNNETVLLLSLGVVLLAVLMAAFLVRQGLLADRQARRLLARQDAIERQGRAFAEIAAHAAQGRAADAEARAWLTERVGEAAGVRRVSLWHLESADSLRCGDAYDRESQGHTRDMELTATELPQLFAALARGEALVKPDAAADPETAELHLRYLHPLGCRSLISVPVRSGDAPLAFLWLEHDGFDAARAEELLGFVQPVANLLTLTLAALSRESASGASAAPERPPPAQAAKRSQAVAASVPAAGSGPPAPASGVSAGVRPALDRLAERVRAGGLAAQLYADTSVMVLELADALALAERAGEEGGATVVDLLVCFLEARARELGIDYLRVVGHQVVAAAGFGSDADQGAQRIATLARDCQSRCSRIFGHLHEGARFRVGLDCGQVLGSPVGEGQKRYNLWGPAVQTALAMASAGVPGEIQVTDAMYQRLREHCLFKPRGAYYVEGTGKLATYLLSGAR